MALWKLGDTSGPTIIAMSPGTPDMLRWTNASMDFATLPRTSIWLAPRVIAVTGLGTYTLTPFNEIDPGDLGVMRICLDQILGVSSFIPKELYSAYVANVNPLLLNAPWI